MEHQHIEYTVVQGIERGFWKWSVSVEGMVVSGQEETRSEAIAAAEKAINRARAIKRRGLIHPILKKVMGMSNNQELATDALRILHGARALPPSEAAEALTPFLQTLEKASGDKVAAASAAAVMELVRSLKENHAASDDLWQQAIETTVSLANEALAPLFVQAPANLLKKIRPGFLRGPTLFGARWTSF
jgi:hypothetical protein